MAATNAAFLDPEGWNSSEINMHRDLAGLLKAPSSSRTAILSLSMLGSLIVVFQGLQSSYEITMIVSLGFLLSQGVGGVFMPLAVGSLIRLVSALWITEDFTFKGYQDVCDIPFTRPTGQEEQVGNERPQAICMQRLRHGTKTNGGQVSSHEVNSHDFNNDDRNKILEGTSSKPLFEDHRYWPSILFRLVMLLFFVTIFISQIIHVIGHQPFAARVTFSGLGMHILYQIMMTVMLVLFIFYLTRGDDKARDTMIPCINSVWYLIYTVVWYALAVVVIIFNALEMRRTSCGVYTTYPPSAGADKALCDFYS